MENPYQAPSSRVEDLGSKDDALAGRWLRLGAVILDGLIQAVIFLPMEFALGIFQQIRERAAAGEMFLPLGTILLLTAIGAVLFVMIQGYPLVTSGQTWGKKICSIRIAGLDGRQPTLKQLLIRYALILLPGRVPFVGGLFGLIDICFIFREDHRCIHDLAAGTRVVNV